MIRRCCQLLLLAGVFVWRSAAAAMPPCRKSPEVHSMVMTEKGSKQGEVVAFGGKGYRWKSRRGRRLSERPEEEDDDEDDDAAEEGLLVGGEPRSAEEAALLSRRGRMRRKVYFFSDTWVFSLETQSWTKVAFPRHSDVPVPRWKPSSCTIDGGTKMVLFGGCRGTDVSGVLNDLWVLHLKSPTVGRWFRISTANPPQKRRGHIAVANQTHLVVAGGKSWTRHKGTEVMRDLWILDLGTLHSQLSGRQMDKSLQKKNSDHGKWVQGTSFPGHARWGSTGTVLAMPDGSDVIAYFGGRNKNRGAAFHSTAGSAYTYYNELWFYSFRGDSWRLVEPVGKSAPCPRDHHAAATDGDGNFYVFGGRVRELKAASSVLNDLWVYNAGSNSWTHLTEGKGPAPSTRFMPGIAFRADQHGDRDIVVFAGENLPGSTKRSSLNDAWAYNLDSTNGKPWTEVLSDNCGPEATGLKEAEEPQEAEDADGGEEVEEVVEKAARLPVFFLAFAGALVLGVSAGWTILACRDASDAEASLLDGDSQPLGEEPGSYEAPEPILG